MLQLGTGGVLGLALGLPLCDLGLLAGKGSLVELEVVVFSVVSFDAFEEQVAVLLQEGVDAQRKAVEVGGQQRR